MDGATPGREQGELARDESSSSRAAQATFLATALRLHYVASSGGRAVFAGRACRGGHGLVAIATDALAFGMGRDSLFLDGA